MTATISVARPRKKVQELAKKLNYQPNPYASSLRRHKSKTIAVIVPEITNSFFALAINGIQSAAREKGYHVLVYVTNENDNVEEESLKNIQNGRVDGLLISVSNKKIIDAGLYGIKEQGMPIVFFDRVPSDFPTTKVTTDDFDSGFKATEHLVKKGCRRIAYLQVSKNLSIGINRMMGYQEALKKYGITNGLIVDCAEDKHVNSKTIRSLLVSENRPDGLFASVEHLAISSYIACKELSLNIPADVKMISFSNLETASLLNPSLTTISQPAFEIGKRAATIFLKALVKKAFRLDDCKFILPSELTVRDSTGGLTH